MSLPPDTLTADHLDTCPLCQVQPGVLFCAQWIQSARRTAFTRDDGGTRRGFRIFADILLDVSQTHIEGRPVLNPAERAAAQFLDILAAADVELCGTLHVSRMRKDVHPHTGEIAWKIP